MPSAGRLGAMNAPQLSPAQAYAHDFVINPQNLNLVKAVLEDGKNPKNQNQNHGVCEFVVRVPSNDPLHFASTIQALHLSLEAAILIVEAALEKDPNKFATPDKFVSWADDALTSWAVDGETWADRGSLLETTWLWYGSFNGRLLHTPAAKKTIATLVLVSTIANAYVAALADPTITAITVGAFSIAVGSLQLIQDALPSDVPQGTSVTVELIEGEVAYYAVTSPTGSKRDARRFVKVLRASSLQLLHIYACSGKTLTGIEHGVRFVINGSVTDNDIVSAAMGAGIYTEKRG